MDSKIKNRLVVIILGAVELAVCYAATILIDLPIYIAIPIFLIPYLTVGLDTIKEAVENIVKGSVFDENFLMTIATIGAFALKDYPEAVFVMLFYQVGELFEEIAEGKSRKSISDLMEICPESATVIRDNAEIAIKPEEIKIGETVLVKPGDKIPVDGVIIKGETEINTVALTGEAEPVFKQKGDNVISGCINLSGLICLRTEKVFKESTAAKIIELVENASGTKSKYEKFITRFAKIYTPSVVILTLLIAVVPILFGGTWTKWLARGIKVLVISCPCALVVSIPLAYFGGIGKASRNGILIKGSEFLEKLSVLDTIVMDKTGTLTEGKFSVKSVLGREDTLKIGASIECHTTHPIGKSIVEAYKNDCFQIDNIKEITGKGIIAEYDGKTYFAGNEKLLTELKIAPYNIPEDGTKVFVGENNNCIGVIILEDKIKQSAIEAVKLFKKMNIKTAMLTGDRISVAEKTANELKIDCFSAELLPVDKVTEFDKITENSKCNGFAGDGINDAPVIKKADLGIAMGAFGSDASIEAADVVLMNDDLSKIPQAIKIARETSKIAKENIYISILVKVAMLAFCVLDGATMIMAVFADVGVLVFAILNSMRLMIDD